MLAVMNDKDVEPARRDKMAVAAAPFVHQRADSTPGKKKEQQGAAQKAASGRFKPGAAPKVVGLGQGKTPWT
jgi:hypothetical protein